MRTMEDARKQVQGIVDDYRSSTEVVLDAPEEVALNDIFTMTDDAVESMTIAQVGWYPKLGRGELLDDMVLFNPFLMLMSFLAMAFCGVHLLLALLLVIAPTVLSAIVGLIAEKVYQFWAGPVPRRFLNKHVFWDRARVRSMVFSHRIAKVRAQRLADHARVEKAQRDYVAAADAFNQELAAAGIEADLHLSVDRMASFAFRHDGSTLMADYLRSVVDALRAAEPEYYERAA